MREIRARACMARSFGETVGGSDPKDETSTRATRSTIGLIDRNRCGPTVVFLMIVPTAFASSV